MEIELNFFWATSTFARMTTPTRRITANGFDLAAGISGRPNDQATLTGTANDEQLIASPTSARMIGMNFLLDAIGFDRVIGIGSAGDDFANVTDSAGADSFTAQPGIAMMEFDGGKSVTMRDFPRIRTVSSTGADEALLNGSANAERFLATTNRYGRLNGTDFSFIAVAYPVVRANGLGGNDDAFLNDSEGVDKVAVLGTDGTIYTSDLSAASPTFTAAADTISARRDGGMSMLPDGRVIITAGGAVQCSQFGRLRDPGMLGVAMADLVDTPHLLP